MANFDDVLANTDIDIEKTMMSNIIINGKEYLAVFDEVPKDMSASTAYGGKVLSGAEYSITLYKSSGYVPTRGDEVVIKSVEYKVTAYHYEQGLIMVQIEK